MNHSVLYDKIRGIVFGQAIGDALGLGTEFMSRAEVLAHYPEGLSEYGQIIKDRHRCRWQQGEWSDDTDMMLCIADAIITDKDICLTTVARNFKNWFKGTPVGIGKHTHNVLSLADYTDNPMKAAETIWKLSGRKTAGNGGLMRTSIVGLWPQDTSSYAENICKLTHPDPRCTGSCVILSKLIHSLVWDGKELESEALRAIGRKYDERIDSYLTLAKEADNITALSLDDETKMGYTLTTLSAALWCLYHAESFREGLLTIVNAGGDADTNAAVACSLLGAKYGFSNIPPYYSENLYRKQTLAKVADGLFEILSAKNCFTGI